ncbi:hypothetical protein PHET_01362 [Paragonimus heterotremus]|uniref:Rho GTPase-activating protein n=1 Tax=Paragonimus heterotremus TaxID=100268 RepID=A0A8J4TGA2_9TREM|nr:hypothetical protein PHET_01362 [Paragonimus heterotremus]
MPSLNSAVLAKNDNPCFISVIGYPGTGTNRVHVGKSCLINRFLCRTPYCEDHLSVLNPSEFDSEVVGNTHWLYWGESASTLNQTAYSKLCIIEHCEFVDDHLFAPISVKQNYVERCLSHVIHVDSRKLAYVCKEQLGDEASFPRTYLEPGRLYISVYICVYDITLSGKTASDQASFLQTVVEHPSLMNFPLVLVTSKHDADVSDIASNYLGSCLVKAKKRWLKRHFCLVETSAKVNINVRKAFEYAVAAASGLLTRLKNAKKSHMSKFDQRFKNFSQFLWRSINGKIQYHAYQPRVYEAGLVPTFFTDVNDSFRFAYSVQYPHQDRKRRKAPPSFVNYRANTLNGSFNASRTALCSKSVTSDHTCGSHSNTVGCMHPNPNRPHLYCRADDMAPVLPTPPPLLLSGPRSPGLFGPTSCPAFFGSKATEHSSLANNLSIVQSSADWPLTRICMHGDAPTVYNVIQSLRAVCPLDTYRTKSGSFYRVWILPGSSALQEELNRFSLKQKSILSSNRRSVSPVRRSFFFSVPRDQNGLTKPHTSAFYVPSNSTDNGTPDSSSDDTRASQSTLPPVAINPSDTIDEHQLLKSSSHPVSQFCFRIFVYSSTSELLSYEDKVHSPRSQMSTNTPDGSMKKCDAVLFWSSSNSTFDSSVPELIKSGIILSSRYGIPFINGNNSISNKLLGHLLNLASNPTDKRKRNFVADEQNDFVSINWTAFELNNHIPIIFKLLEATAGHWTASVNPSEFIPSLVSLVSFNKEIERHDECESDQDRPTLGGVHRLFYLPPTVTAPTAVKPELKSPLTKTVTLLQTAPRFAFLHQLNDLLDDGRGTSESVDAALRVVFIYYLVSAWPSIEVPLCKSLESLLNVPSSSGDSGTCSSFSSPVNIVVLVAIHEQNKTENCSTTTMGIRAGLDFFKNFARIHNYSFLFINDFYHPGDVRVTNTLHCPSSVCESVPRSTSNTIKPQLLFLSVSTKDSFETAIHRLALQGHPSVWSRVPGFQDMFADRLCPTMYPPASILTAISSGENPLQPSCGSIPVCSSEPSLGAFSLPYCDKFSVVSSEQRDPHVRACAGSLPLRNNGANMVALPWIPLSPAEALRLPTSRLNSASFKNEFGVCCLGSSTERQTNLFSPPGSSTYATGEMRSSVEEYYAELPKVQEQQNLFAVEQRQRRVSRPKRPCPCVSSINSPSSSPSSVTTDLDLSFCPNLSDSRAATSTGSLVCLLTSTADEVVSRCPTGCPLPNDSDTGVYAEVNDALVSELSASSPPSLSADAHFRLSQKINWPCSYDSSYASLCDSTLHKHLSPESLDHVCGRTSRIFQNPVISDYEFSPPAPHTLTFPRPPPSHPPPPPPSCRSAMASRPLPSIVTTVCSPISSACTSCRHHSSPPPAAAQAYLISSVPTDICLQSIIQPSFRRPSFPVHSSAQHSAPTTTHKSCAHDTPSTTTVSHMFALDSLAASIRRRGFWFRTSATMPSCRKQKS